MEDRSVLEIVDATGSNEETDEPGHEFDAGLLDVKPLALGSRGVMGSLQSMTGWERALVEIPGLGSPDLYMEVARFTACERSGSAQFLRIAGEPGGKIASSGILVSQSHPVSTRLELSFWAFAGPHVITSRLVNWAGPYRANVDASIDGIQLGRVEIFGPTTRSFVVRLTTGAHSFFLREVNELNWAPWLFQSLSVTAIPVVKEAVPA